MSNKENFKPCPRQPKREEYIFEDVYFSIDTEEERKKVLIQLKDMLDRCDDNAELIGVESDPFSNGFEISIRRSETDEEYEERYQKYQKRMEEWAEWNEANPGQYEKVLKERREKRKKVHVPEVSQSYNELFDFDDEGDNCFEEAPHQLVLPDDSIIWITENDFLNIKWNNGINVHGKHYHKFTVNECQDGSLRIEVHD